jgi:hypothetical protein
VEVEYEEREGCPTCIICMQRQNHLRLQRTLIWMGKVNLYLNLLMKEILNVLNV